jgi:hypothetical protein
LTATTTPRDMRVTRTEPQPGDRIIIGHRVCLVNDRGGYDYPSEPIAPIPGPAPVLVNAPGQAIVDWGWVALLVGGLGLVAVWWLA